MPTEWRVQRLSCSCCGPGGCRKRKLSSDAVQGGWGRWGVSYRRSGHVPSDLDVSLETDVAFRRGEGNMLALGSRQSAVLPSAPRPGNTVCRHRNRAVTIRRACFGASGPPIGMQRQVALTMTLEAA